MNPPNTFGATERPEAEDDFLSEATTPYEQSGVAMSDLIASGLFDCVTDAHREKARKYWAKRDAARAARDLFS